MPANTLLSFEGTRGPCLWQQYGVTATAAGLGSALIANGTGRTILAMRLWPNSNASDAEFAFMSVVNQSSQPLPSPTFITVIPCQTGAVEPTPVGLPIDYGQNNTINIGGLTNAHTYRLYVLFERTGARAECP